MLYLGYTLTDSDLVASFIDDTNNYFDPYFVSYTIKYIDDIGNTLIVGQEDRVPIHIATGRYRPAFTIPTNWRIGYYFVIWKFRNKLGCPIFYKREKFQIVTADSITGIVNLENIDFHNPYYSITGINYTGIQCPQKPAVAIGDTGVIGPTGPMGITGAAAFFIQKNARYVDLNGSDTTGNGSSTNPYRTIKFACDSILDSGRNNPYSIFVNAGLYEENPFLVPEQVGIFSMDEMVILVANDPDTDFITLSNFSNLQSMEIRGPINATAIVSIDVLPVMNGIYISSGKRGIRISGSGASDSELVETYIDLDVEEGISIEDGVNNVVFRGLFSYAYNYALRISGGSKIILNNFDIQNTVTGIIVESTGTDVSLKVGRISGSEVGIKTDDSSTSTLVAVIFESCNVDLVQIGGSYVYVDSSTIHINLCIVEDWDRIIGQFFNIDDFGSGLKIQGRMDAGSPELGAIATIGEGSSESRGLKVFEYNALTDTFVDVSSSARQIGGPTFTFPSNEVNSAVYVSTEIKDANSLYYKIKGIRTNTLTAAVLGTGNIVSEYWNGSTWYPFNTMSFDTVNFYTYGNNLFQRVTDSNTSEMIHFSCTIEEDWTDSDPMLSGTYKYWIRFRIASPISVLPIFDYYRIITSRTRIEKDGFMTFSGKARSIRRAQYDIDSSSSIKNLPATVNLYRGDIGVSRYQNSFTKGDLCNGGYSFFVPFDLDTSCPLIVKVVYMVLDDSAGDVEIVFKWDITSINSDVYNTIQSPTPTESIVSIPISIPSNSSFKQMFFTGYVPIPTSVPYAGDESNLLWGEMSRDGRYSNSADTYQGDFNIIQISIEYVAWNNGRHI